MDAVLRILDASLNRVREGWRVMEDAARFHLNDPAMCERLKTLRHGLQTAVRDAGLDDALLMRFRDTHADVGATIKTPTEQSRTALRDAVIAAGKRVGEALRSVEEAVKVRSASLGAIQAGPAPYQAFERLRYRHYDVEKELVLSMGSARPCPQWRLCVIITESLCKLPWWEVAKLAKAGGADCLQLREKGLRDAELLKRARWLTEIAHTREEPSVFDPQAEPGPAAHVIINDRPDIALMAGADGVHLGRHDLPLSEARRFFGERLWIGYSTHFPDEAAAAQAHGADYCGVGAMFPTATKQEIVSGPAYLRAYLDEYAAIPHLAIGGITPAHVPELVAAGVRGIAVSSVVCTSGEPGAVCRELRRALGATGA